MTSKTGYITSEDVFFSVVNAIYAATIDGWHYVHLDSNSAKMFKGDTEIVFNGMFDFINWLNAQYPLCFNGDKNVYFVAESHL